MSRRVLPTACSRFLIVAAVLAVPALASADLPTLPSFAQAGINDAAAGVPETGAAAGTSALASASVDPATGIATASIPMAYPKARGHAQPRISLGYSSVSGQGFAGWGWTLGFPEIERTTLSGPPTYNDHFGDPTPSDDRFSFEGQPLVPICQVSQCGGLGSVGGVGLVPPPAVPPESWYFRLENDTLHAEFFWFPTTLSWLAVFPSGETLEFGQPLENMWDGMGQNSIDFDFSVAPQQPPYRWYVVRQYDAQRDSSGQIANPIVYGWQKVDEPRRNELRSYLSDVWDTPAPGSSPRQMPDFAHHVHFQYTPPSKFQDPGVVDPPIWRVLPASTLTTIDVTSASFPSTSPRYELRRYHLAYEEYNNRFYLNAVTTEGRCAQPAAEDSVSGELPSTTNCPTLPPTQFSYLLPPTVPQTVTIDGTVPPNATILDVNADGVPDFVGDNTSTLQTVALNGSGVAPDVLIHQAISLTPVGFLFDQFPAPPKFNPVASPGSFAAGVALTDGNVNPIWTQHEYLVDYPLQGDLQDLFLQQAFTPMPGSVAPGAQWTWTPQGSLLGLLPIGPFMGNADCSNGSTIVTVQSPEQPLAATDVDGDGFIDEVTAIETIQSQNQQIVYCCNVDGNGNCTGECQKCGINGDTAKILSVSFNSRFTKLNPDGSTGLYGALKESFATIQDIQNWPILPSADVADFYEDMNGDGLSDLVVIDLRRYPQEVGYLPGQGTGAVGVCPNGGQDCSASARLNPPQVTWMLNGAITSTALQNVYAHDLNGDGLADIILGKAGDTDNQRDPHFEILLNINGAELGTPILLNVAGYDPTKSRVMFADMNGSGVDDLVVITGNYATYVDVLSGARPGLLSTIQNGKGATTTLEYASTVDLARCSRGAPGCSAGPTGGSAWVSETPQVMHPVTRLTTTNNLGSVDAVNEATEFSYSDPVYDGRDRTFRGFRSVRQLSTSSPVDPSDPPVQSTTQFLVGRCQEDYPNGSCPQFSVDRPFGVLGGLPVDVDTYDLQGHALSSVHTTYHVNSVAGGADGRSSRFAYPGTIQTYLYDSSARVVGTRSQTANTVVFDDGTGVIATASFATYRTAGFGARRSPGATAVLEVDRTEDQNGNVVDTMDWGRKGFDPPVHTTTTWYSPPGDVTGWLWRPHTKHLDPTSDPSVTDFARDITADFDAFGNVTDMFAVIRGTGPLARGNAGGARAPDPSSSAEGSTVLLRHVDYTDWGAPRTLYGANGNHCAQIQYDQQFQQLAVQELTFTGAQCTGTAITRNRQYDRGFEQVSMEIAPSGAISSTTFEPFGRPQNMFKPDPSSGAPASQPGTTIQYFDNASGPQLVYTQEWDGGAYRGSWEYTDGLGHPLLTLREADMTAGDPAPWVVTDARRLSAKGGVLGRYVPFFWGGGGAAGSQYPLQNGFASNATTTTYDAFGHVLQQTDAGGTVVQQRQNHALSVEVWDGEELPGGLHPGASITRTLDGHGRTVAISKNTTVGGQPATVQTRQSFTSSGKVASISQVSGSHVVTRTVRYDTLGHIVYNFEPNSSLFASSKFFTNGAWRYVYDDNGNLVGTSDARGCGENIAYDPLGRVISEDFSPCAAGQPSYSPPQGMDGTESYLVYDDVSQPLPAGRLIETFDRGADTKYGYDFRDRLTSVQRRIAKPNDFGDPVTGDRYAPHWYSRAVEYNDLDQPVEEGTGADTDFAGLLGAFGGSLVATTYSARGLPSQVGGSYGQLIKSVNYTADSLPLTRIYGDIAATTQDTKYDVDRRPSRVTVGRQAPASWTGLPSQVAQLEDIAYTYDKMGHPIQMTDSVDAVPWPDGAKPRSASLVYDDYYRIQEFVAGYHTGSRRRPVASHEPDSWTSPLQAEEEAKDTVVLPVIGAPRRLTHLTFAYDWLGNLASSSDDSAVFYDRSLGTVTNNPDSGVGPNQLVGAAVPGASGGNLAAAYDPSGNLVDLRVARQGPCNAPEGCNQHFIYVWDEVGQLAETRRWDFTSVPPPADPSGDFYATAPTSTPQVDVMYVYDVTGRRVVRSTASTEGTYFTAEIFPTLRLEHAQADGAGDYTRNAETESVYLFSNGSPLGRVTAAGPPSLGSAPGSAPVGASPRVLLELSDSLGSTSFVLDHNTSELLERVTYQPYGATEADFRPANWGSYREPYRFTGKEDDSEAGLTYFGARYYSPSLQRFVSPDPKTIHSLTGDLNPYAYVSGNVTATVDPTGLSPAGDPLPNYDPFSTYGQLTALSPIANQTPIGQYLGQFPAGDAQNPLQNYFLGALYGVALFISPAVDPWLSSLGLPGIAEAVPGPAGTIGDLGAYAAGFVTVQALPLLLGGGQAEGVQGLGVASLAERGVMEGAELALSGTEALRTETNALTAIADMESTQGLAEGFCFAAGTPVWTTRGELPVEDVRVGDRVVSQEPSTGELQIDAVVRLFSHIDSSLVDVSVLSADGIQHVTVTSGHPFWVQGRGWTPAVALDPGSELDSPSDLSVVAATRKLTDSQVVYNFEVQHSHTYFVGSSPVLVHNACSIGAGNIGEAYDRSAYVSSSYKWIGAPEVAPGAVCQYCQVAPAAQIDHIISARAAHDVASMGLMPVSDIRVALSGTENLAGACGPCNLRKGPFLPGNVPGTWLPPNPSPRVIGIMQQLGTWSTE